MVKMRRFDLSMNRLHSEWARLLAVDPGAPDNLIDPQGRTRALVVAWGHPADWSTLAALWQAVQAELDWPAPLIAVDGHGAFQLWFPLAEPVPVHTAQQVAAALAARWLPRAPAEAVARRLSVWPRPADGSWQHAAPVPARLPGPEPRWSAFVAPDLAAVFNDEPALDIDPGDDAQAELLARHRCIDARAWAQACQTLLAPERAPTAVVPEPATHEPATETALSDLAGPFDDPAAFLKAVMNHPGAPLAQRIEAARALLLKRP
jgi:hypothetical protein